MSSERVLSSSQASILVATAGGAAAVDGLATTGRIAVVGSACRLPGANDPEALWELLKAGRDSISHATDERFRIMGFSPERVAEARRLGLDVGGYIEHFDRFDPTLFGISFGEAAEMDPQQRILLETTWSALENSGLSPEQIAGSRAGVFVGIGSYDYILHQAALDPKGKRVTPYSALGNAHSIAANRLSYVFDLKGPSLAVDTACSSSLYALHHARHSLLRHECDSAIVGGVHLILSVNVQRAFKMTHMLAKDGRTKVFDAAADGYVRAEGCVVVVLKRLADAISAGDQILGLIVGSAVNQDGKTEGITAPNGDMQVAAINAALASAGLDQRSIGYVEANGTGTKRGDTIELEALARVFCGERTSPCHLGSIAANLGHLEPVRGLAGLLKVLLCFRHEEIAGQANFGTANPAAEADGARISVASSTVQWPRGRTPRRAGLSSFGFGGANAHVVIEEPPTIRRLAGSTFERPVHALKVSARTPAQIAEMADRLGRALSTVPAPDLADACFSANVGRADFSDRVVVTGRNREAIVEKLRLVAEAQAARPATRGPAKQAKPRVALVPTGDGAYQNMGLALFRSAPIFAETLHASDAILRPLAGSSLIDWLYRSERQNSPTSSRSRFENSAIFAVNLGLARLWKSWGIEPDRLLGLGVGEYVAAVLDNVMTFEDALRLVYRCDELMDPARVLAASLAVSCDEARLTGLLAQLPASKIEISVFSGPGRVVISCAPAAIEAFQSVARTSGIDTHRLDDGCLLSPLLVGSALAGFRQTAAGCRYSMPSPKLVSAALGRTFHAEELADAGYWADHIRRPVRFWHAMEAVLASGVDTVVEVGPGSNLLAGVADELRNRGVTVVTSLARGADDWDTLTTGLTTLHEAGHRIDWKGWDAPYPRRRLAMPNYPFAREAFWHSSEGLAANQQASSEPAKPDPLPLPARRVPGRAEIIDLLRTSLSEVTGTPLALLSESSQLSDASTNKEFDSVVGLEIGLRLEESLGIQLSADNLSEENTLGEIADFIVEVCKATHGTAVSTQNGAAKGDGVAPPRPSMPQSSVVRALPVLPDPTQAHSPHAALDDPVRNPADYCDAIRPDFTGGIRDLSLDLDCYWAEGDRLKGRIGGVDVSIIDMLGGYGSTLFGHNHPALVAVMREALLSKRPQFVQMSNRTAAGMLAKALVRQVQKVTGGNYFAVLGSTGGEVVDAAIKHVLAEWAARRSAWQSAQGDDAPGLDLPPAIFAVEGSYHGKTLGAYSLTWNAPGRSDLGLNSPFEVVWLRRNDPDHVLAEFAARTINAREGGGSWSRIAGVFVEPIQGEGGVFPLSEPYLQAIRRAADTAGCSVVVDEIQSGLGRCGGFLASSLRGLKGDHYLFGKALGGGLTKSSALLLAAERYQPGFGFIHTSTYAEDDHTALVGLKALQLIEQDGLSARAAETGAYLLDRLSAVKSRYPTVVREVRGQGLLAGVELADQSGSSSPLIRDLFAQRLLGIIVAGCMLHRHGVRVGTTLSHPSTLRFEPSAYVSRADIDHVVDALGDVCRMIEEGEAGLLTRHVARADLGLGLSRVQVKRQPNRVGNAVTTADPCHRGTAVFLGHMIDADDMSQWDTSLMRLSTREREQLAKRIAHPIPVMSIPIRAETGETVDLDIHTLALTSSVIEQAFRGGQRDQIVTMVNNAVERFAAENARVVGLGGLLSVISGNGLDVVRRNPSLIVTTGNTYTVALASEAVLTATASCGLDPARTRLGVVGAGGNIGSTVVRVLAHRFGRLRLVGRKARLAAVERTAHQVYEDAWQRWVTEGAKAGGLAAALGESGVLDSIRHAGTDAGATLAGLGARIRAALVERYGEDPLVGVTDSIADIEDCPVIVTSSNSAEPILGPHNVGKAVVLICDLSVPSDIAPDLPARRPDLTLIRGGVALAPGGMSFRIESARLPPGHLLGCMAETAILGLAGANCYPATGEITPEGVLAAAALGQKYGFSLGYANFDKLFAINRTPSTHS